MKLNCAAVMLNIFTGCAEHWLLAQPYWQVVFTCGYWHVPAEQPVAVKFCSVVLFMQVAAGGLLHGSLFANVHAAAEHVPP